MKTLALILLYSLGVVGSGAAQTFTNNDATNRPFLAVWRDHEGYPRPGAPDSQAPFLRYAIWDDGRFLYAKNPRNWGHELLEGRIDTNRIAELKQAVEKTGVFELKRTGYLVPDAPTDCVMVDVGGKQQTLYWDERETPGYGINANPKEQELKFISCWKEINSLALKAIPNEGRPYGKRFEPPPQSWYPKNLTRSQ